MHGTADKVIALSQSEELYRAMKQVGSSCELIVLPGANHAFVCTYWRAPEAVVVDAMRQIDDYMCRHGFYKESQIWSFRNRRHGYLNEQGKSDSLNRYYNQK